MPFFAELSQNPDGAAALRECLDAAAGFSGKPDLVLVFFSPHHAAQAAAFAEQAWNALQPRCLLGCPGEAIVGGDREVENGPALSLWLGSWPEETTVSQFHLTMEQTSEGLSILGWPDELGEGPPEEELLLLLADPFTFPVDEFLQRVNEDYPGVRVVGGMASGGRNPGENSLLIGSQTLTEGAVGILLQGTPRVRTVVSQGCRPIGRPLVVTKAQHNYILELGGKPPLEHLQQIWQESSPADQELLQRGLHVGRVINEYQDAFTQGDFLIRNVMGLDKNTGALAITERVRVGQTIQFHVRDAATADEDLRLLAAAAAHGRETRPAGGLLFSCNGRGTRLFEVPDHDARSIQRALGPMPLAGFFAMGELGPIGGQNFIHGFTASLVLFDDP